MNKRLLYFSLVIAVFVFLEWRILNGNVIDDIPQENHSIPVEPNKQRVLTSKDLATGNGGDESSPTNQILELFTSIDSFDQSTKDELYEIAAQRANERDPQEFIRWRPLIIADVASLLDTSKVGTNLQTIGKESVRFSPFQGSSFVARNESFRHFNWGFTWTGKITEGGNGRVTVHVVPNDSGEQIAIITIVSDVGGFSIRNTSRVGLYVAFEGNPAYHPSAM